MKKSTIIIISIIVASITIPIIIMYRISANFQSSAEEANLALADTQLKIFNQHCKSYKLLYKTQPSSLDDLVNTPNRRPLLDEIPDDPWGNPYILNNNGKIVMIFSSGPDGIPGNSDDIIEYVTD